MQPKYTHNKSNIIKVTEEAKRKSRQRLIGSIILLFFALVVLLNVTAKVKPIPINPEVVEIKSNASANLAQAKPLASSPVASAGVAGSIAANTTGAASAPTTVNSPGVIAAPGTNQIQPGAKAPVNQAGTAAPATAPIQEPAAANNSFKAGVVNTDSTTNKKPEASKHPLPLQGTINQAPQHDQSVEINKTAAEKPKAKTKPQAVNPADILDGLVDSDNATVDKDPEKPAKSTKSYIQFAALSSQEKADELKQLLASKGINATVQPIHTAKGTLYRLRAGPFNHSDAEQKLHRVAAEGYHGIVTGN